MRQMQKEKLLPEQTAEKIREYIESNGMKTGDKLPNEFQLAEICGVGRSTIREAIKLLVFSGKVEAVRGSGTYIKKEKAPQGVTMANDDPLGFLENSEENLFQTCLEFVDVRLMLEPEVAAMAATNADYADCQKLQMLQREVGQLVDQGKDHIAADIEYHKQLAACTHNQILCNLMEIVVKGIPLFVKITKNDFAKSTVEQHRAITEAISAGDAQGARYGMITHLNSNRKRILKALTEQKTTETV